MEPKIGIVYRMQPESPDPDACTYFEAGAVTFALEYRDVDPERLARAYADNTDDLAELERHSPKGGFSDRGVSIHVLGTQDEHEYLRFDAFDSDPHYHYVRPSGDHNHWVPFDPIAGGDMLSFALICLRDRLAPMLVEAGGEAVAKALEPRRVAGVVEKLERKAREAQERHRAALG